MTRAERLTTAPAPAPTVPADLPTFTAPAEILDRVRALGRWRIEHIGGTDRWAAWLRPPTGGVRFYTEAAGWASCAATVTRVHQTLITVEILRKGTPT